MSTRRRRYQDSPQDRHQANARERDRTQSVNRVFGILRRLIPTSPSDRKLSKIETLKLARSYIDHLEAVLKTVQVCPLTSVTKSCIEDDSHHRLYVDGAWIEVTHENMERTEICTFCLSAHNPIKLSVATSLIPGIINADTHTFEFLF